MRFNMKWDLILKIIFNKYLKFVAILIVSNPLQFWMNLFLSNVLKSISAIQRNIAQEVLFDKPINIWITLLLDWFPP